jgi:hypothetical protein
VTLGRALMEVGRLQEAQQELEFVLKLAPENLAAIRGLAEIHHRLGDEHAHSAVPVAPPVETVPVEPIEAISVTEVQAASGAIEAAPPPQPDQSAVPALEQLLSDIQRARVMRAAAR